MTGIFDPAIFDPVIFDTGDGGAGGGDLQIVWKYEGDDITADVDLKTARAVARTNGGVGEAIVKVLDKTLQSAPTPLRFGSLVVFTDGTDRARRVQRPDLDKALDDAVERDVSLYVIGVGTEIDSGELRNIGRRGSFLTKDPTVLAKAFDAIAERVEAFTKSFYLLSYCSPARAQEHDLKVAASASGKSGSLTYRFDANGFGPNCDANRLPKFDIHNPIKRVPAKKGK